MVNLKSDDHIIIFNDDWNIVIALLLENQRTMRWSCWSSPFLSHSLTGEICNCRLQQKGIRNKQWVYKFSMKMQTRYLQPIFWSLIYPWSIERSATEAQSLLLPEKSILFFAKKFFHVLKRSQAIKMPWMWRRWIWLGLTERTSRRHGDESIHWWNFDGRN